MSAVSTLSQVDRIILAAERLSRARQNFTGAELVVAVWDEFREEFGLAGYKDEHPDANKVLSYVMGEKGMVKRGFLIRNKDKTYRLTHQAHARAEHCGKLE